MDRRFLRQNNSFSWRMAYGEAVGSLKHLTRSSKKATRMLKTSNQNHLPKAWSTRCVRRPRQGCSVTTGFGAYYAQGDSVVQLFGGSSVAVTFGKIDRVGLSGWCMISHNQCHSDGARNRGIPSGRQAGAFVRFHRTLSIG